MAVNHSREPLSGVRLSATASAALDIAAARAATRPISTADLVLGSMAADPSGNWEVFARNGPPLAQGAPPDPEPEAAARWIDASLSGSAAQALDAAVHAAAELGLGPVSPGLIALGALTDPSTGAARGLMAHAGLSHPELLRLLQRDVLHDVAAEPTSARAPSPSATSSEGALDLLIDAVENGRSAPGLGQLLDAMLLIPEDLRRLAQTTFSLEDEPAAQTRRRAQQRFETDEPDAAACIVAAVLASSPRMREVLRRLAITPEQIVAVVAEWRLRADGDEDRDLAAFAAGLLNGLASVVTSVLIVMSALGDDGHLWRLVLVYFAWVGYPQTGPVAAGALAAMLALLASPAAGLAQAMTIVTDVLQASAARRVVLRRTGVHLSLSQTRTVAMCLLSARGRRVLRMRQLWMARVAAWQDEREA